MSVKLHYRKWRIFVKSRIPHLDECEDEEIIDFYDETEMKNESYVVCLPKNEEEKKLVKEKSANLAAIYTLLGSLHKELFVLKNVFPEKWLESPVWLELPQIFKNANVGAQMSYSDEMMRQWMQYNPYNSLNHLTALFTYLSFPGVQTQKTQKISCKDLFAKLMEGWSLSERGKRFSVTYRFRARTWTAFQNLINMGPRLFPAMVCSLARRSFEYCLHKRDALYKLIEKKDRFGLRKFLLSNLSIEDARLIALEVGDVLYPEIEAFGRFRRRYRSSPHEDKRKVIPVEFIISVLLKEECSHFQRMDELAVNFPSAEEEAKLFERFEVCVAKPGEGGNLRVFFPRTILEKIVSNIPKDKYFLNSLGLVCRKWHWFMYRNWGPLRINPKNIYYIPPYLLSNARKIILAGSYSWPVKQYVIADLRENFLRVKNALVMNVKYLDFTSEKDHLVYFLRALGGKDTILPNCTSLKLCGLMTRSHQPKTGLLCFERFPNLKSLKLGLLGYETYERNGNVYSLIPKLQQVLTKFNNPKNKCKELEFTMVRESMLAQLQGILVNFHIKPALPQGPDYGSSYYRSVKMKKDNRFFSAVKKCAFCGKAKKKSGKKSKLSFGLCGRCRSVSYCSIDHQKKHWKKHREICKQIVSARKAKKKAAKISLLDIMAQQESEKKRLQEVELARKQKAKLETANRKKEHLVNLYKSSYLYCDKEDCVFPVNPNNQMVSCERCKRQWCSKTCQTKANCKCMESIEVKREKSKNFVDSLLMQEKKDQQKRVKKAKLKAKKTPKKSPKPKGGNVVCKTCPGMKSELATLKLKLQSNQRANEIQLKSLKLKSDVSIRKLKKKLEAERMKMKKSHGLVKTVEFMLGNSSNESEVHKAKRLKLLSSLSSNTTLAELQGIVARLLLKRQPLKK